MCVLTYHRLVLWQVQCIALLLSTRKIISVIKSAFKGDEDYMMTNAYYREERYITIMAKKSSIREENKTAWNINDTLAIHQT